jgi:polar amino acid transport system substrate-binding protein
MIAFRAQMLTLLLAALPFAAGAFAPDAIKRQLASTGTMRVAINYNNPLLAMRDPSTGEISGLAADLAKELGRRAGVPIELVPFDSAGKITSSAQDNVWDVAFLAIDPVRGKSIDFTAAYIELEGTYMVAAAAPFRRIEDIDRDGVRIAVTAGSAYDLVLSRELQHAQIVRADNTPKSMELMLEQKLDAVAAVRTALAAEAKRVPNLRVLKGHFMTIPQAVGVPRGRPVAARYVSQFIEEMKASGFVQTLLERYGHGPDDAIVAPLASVRR